MRLAVNQPMTRIMLAVLLVTAISAAPLAQEPQQNSEEVAVPIVNLVAGRGGVWVKEGSGVIDEARFKELQKTDKYGFLKRLNIDFSLHTLIMITVHGDCFVRSSATLTRHDQAKKILCRVQKIYGGCRAAGSYQSWIVINKIPADYNVEMIYLPPIDERDEK